MTKKYKVLVEETLSRIVEVEAKDESEAEDIVNKMYDNEEIILGNSDLSDTLIREENCW